MSYSSDYPGGYDFLAMIRAVADSKITGVFISHIAEEKDTALRLKRALRRDFRKLIDVYVSSDAGANPVGRPFLPSLRKVLKNSSVFIVLCSPESIHRNWVNFEVGAAWIRGIRIIPVCHLKLSPKELTFTLSSHQGLELDDPLGLASLYELIAEILSIQVPKKDFEKLSCEIRGKISKRTQDQMMKRYLVSSLLNDSPNQWRALYRLAEQAGISENRATRLLELDDRVSWGWGEGTGNRIVGIFFE